MAGAERRQRAGRDQKQSHRQSGGRNLVFQVQASRKRRHFPNRRDTGDETDYEDFPPMMKTMISGNPVLSVWGRNHPSTVDVWGGRILWCNPKFGSISVIVRGSGIWWNPFLVNRFPGRSFRETFTVLSLRSFRESGYCTGSCFQGEKMRKSDAVEGKGRRKKNHSRLRQFGKVGIVIPVQDFFPERFLAEKGRNKQYSESVERAWIRHAFRQEAWTEFTWKDASDCFPASTGTLSCRSIQCSEGCFRVWRRAIFRLFQRILHCRGRSFGSSKNTFRRRRSRKKNREKAFSFVLMPGKSVVRKDSKMSFQDRFRSEVWGERRAEFYGNTVQFW